MSDGFRAPSRLHLSIPNCHSKGAAAADLEVCRSGRTFMRAASNRGRRSANLASCSLSGQALVGK